MKQHTCRDLALALLVLPALHTLLKLLEIAPEGSIACCNVGAHLVQPPRQVPEACAEL
jgi:hypothetical protein